jgi:hypothetical protein
VIISSAHYCSPHGLEATLAHVRGASLVVDLRNHGRATVEVGERAIMADLAS